MQAPIMVAFQCHKRDSEFEEEMEEEEEEEEEGTNGQFG
jgi:hypothetical protein